MDEIVVLRISGDEQSTLLDGFERSSFEVQLNQVLGRSLTSSAGGFGLGAPLIGVIGLAGSSPPPLLKQVKRGRRGSGFLKALKMLLKPILGKKGNRG